MENKFGKRQWKKEEKRFKTLDEYLSYQEKVVGKAKEITEEERRSLKGKRKVTGFEVTDDHKKKQRKNKDDRQNKKRAEAGKDNKKKPDKSVKKSFGKEEKKTSGKTEKKQAEKKLFGKAEKKGGNKKNRERQETETVEIKRNGKKQTDRELQEKRQERETYIPEEPENRNYESYAGEEQITGEAEENANRIEGRNAVTEAFRSGRDVDKLFVQKELHDGAILTITRLARKCGTIINYVSKDRLNQMSQTGAHQGVIAYVASYNYSSLEDILKKAADKGEDPFIFLLDGIEDPHNLGAIIRTANLCGAHGVVITKHRAAGLTATVAKASAGALNYTPVAKVTNLGNTIDQLKKDGMWFVCADMGGTNMYQLELKGSIGLIIGNEGDGVSRLIRERCDFIASIPMKGDIDSLNASVAAGVLGFEIARQRG